MLIYIRRSGCKPVGDALSGLENLAAAGLNGQHLVLGDRSVLKELGDEVALSSRARSFYQYVAQQITQLGSVLRTFDRISVDASDSGTAVVGDVVPAGVFADPDMCEKSQLLVENLTDYTILKSLAELCLKRSLPGTTLKLRALNGGGSTTHQVLEHEDRAASGPVLCIVDSDRRFPGDKLGSTATAVRGKFRKCGAGWRLRLSVLASRELENLIPVSLREQACAALEEPVRKDVAALRDFNQQYLMFCCLKTGDSMCQMVCDAISKKRYEMIPVIGSMWIKNMPMVDKCGTCPYETGCVKSPGLGARFLQRVSEILHASRWDDLSGLPEELLKILLLVSNIGLAWPVKRV